MFFSWSVEFQIFLQRSVSLILRRNKSTADIFNVQELSRWRLFPGKVNGKHKEEVVVKCQYLTQTEKYVFIFLL